MARLGESVKQNWFHNARTVDAGLCYQFSLWHGKIFFKGFFAGRFCETPT